jgi:hypothetical protein
MKRAWNIQIFLNRSAFVACAIFATLLSANAAEKSASRKITNAIPDSSSERLEFLDGSTLHGHLRSIDSTNGLKWEHPAARQPILFKPDNVAWVRFPAASQFSVSNSKPTCKFEFANGDEFFGDLVSLDSKELELQTWFGGKFKTPRSMVKLIRFFPKGAATIYEGPSGLEGWHLGKMPNPAAWKYEDGAFLAEGAGTIGRDMNLPDASRVEFDLTWSAPFSLLFSFYTSMLDGFNYNSSSYMFYMTAGNISLQRINAGAGSSTIGRTERIPAMLTKRTVHLEFRGNKEESLLELLADGKPVAQWRDNAGWIGNGSGILFYSQTEGGMKISNIKVSSWDGKSGLDVSTNQLTADRIFLANRDQVSGKVAGVLDGKLKITSSAANLEIPLERITQIAFANGGTNPVPPARWEIQASVSGGGTISFAVEKWNDKTVSGKNRNFGKISLNSKSIRQIQFNLDQSKADFREQNSADEIFWEADEE